MILTDNVLLLKNQFPQVYNVLKNMEGLPLSHIQNNNTADGRKTVTIQRDDTTWYLHSRYNPQNEARQFIDGLGDLDGTKHVFFFGVGLGYHIQELFHRVPEINISVFEPDHLVFRNFLQECNLKDFSFKNWKNIYLGYEHVDTYLANFVSKIKEGVMLVVLPSYERAFETETKDFYSKFKTAISSTRDSLVINTKYEKLWTINSIKNFPKVLNTSSVIREKSDIFRGKPAILAAAGPSLQDEFENLRYIKENGLAYIFAVGSANKALIAQGIYPDALATYDPNPWNYMVYEEIIDQKLDVIPLIFGSSVDFRTVMQYPGPLLHVITTQDSVASFFLNHDELKQKGEIVNDAPSIAVLTFELLVRFGVNEIILVGQNLANRENQYYAKGVNYKYRQSEFLSEAEQVHQFAVEDVYGNTVLTDRGNNSIRLTLEHYISLVSNSVKVINTTKGGAKIKGTIFETLDTVIQTSLTKRVVEENWHCGESTKYNREFLKTQLKNFVESNQQFQDILESVTKNIKKLDQLSAKRDHKNLLPLFPKMDKAFSNLVNNIYFNVILKPMLRVQYRMLARNIESIRIETDPVKKADMAVKHFGGFIYDCQILHRECESLVKELINTAELYAYEAGGQYRDSQPSISGR